MQLEKVLKPAALSLGERCSPKGRASEKGALIGPFTLVHATAHMRTDLGVSYLGKHLGKFPKFPVNQGNLSLNAQGTLSPSFSPVFWL